MKRHELDALIQALITMRDGATDEQAIAAAAVYPQWREDGEYAVDNRVQHKGKLYRCLTDHTAQSMWTPEAAPSLWAEILPGQGGTEIGEWVQPGSTNPYKKGDRVTYQGKTWESTIEGNVWAPGVYGWVTV